MPSFDETRLSQSLRSALRRSIPWLMIASHEAQAMKNHGQSLVRLNERGGLSVHEAIAVLQDRPLPPLKLTSDADARAMLESLVEAFERNQHDADTDAALSA